VLQPTAGLYHIIPDESKECVLCMLLVTGLFDDCLKEQPELGSQMLSNAQLQYQASVTLQNRQVIYTLIHIDFLPVFPLLALGLS